VQDTKGSIVGQVAALEKAAEYAGFKVHAQDVDKFFAGRSPEECEYYAKHGHFEDDVRPKKQLN